MHSLEINWRQNNTTYLFNHFYNSSFFIYFIFQSGRGVKVNIQIPLSFTGDFTRRTHPRIHFSNINNIVSPRPNPLTWVRPNSSTICFSHHGRPLQSTTLVTTWIMCGSFGGLPSFALASCSFCHRYSSNSLAQPKLFSLNTIWKQKLKQEFNECLLDSVFFSSLLWTIANVCHILYF